LSAIHFEKILAAGIVDELVPTPEEDALMMQRRRLLQVLSYAFGSGVVLPRSGFAVVGQNAAPAAKTAPPASTAAQESPAREKVAGIGGLFFRAHDPDALSRWYLDNLGIALTPTAKDSPVWQQEAGQTVFSPFPEKTRYFGDPEKVWMVNFRVHNLDRMAAQLQAAGIEVKVDPQTYPNGHFARLHDPEGNPIEL
jgi:glyoxylase I family protein